MNPSDLPDPLPSRTLELSAELTRQAPIRVTRLRNVRCIYCGCEERPDFTEEHVIGRKFVPSGTLNGQWNLIARACRQCNAFKADLEDDISAITMQPDAEGFHPSADALKDGKRKAAGAASRRTGKKIAESEETVSFEGAFNEAVVARLSLTGPPQLETDRAARLAHFHIRAFFYLITYQKDERHGRYWRGLFICAQEAARSDWGNVRQLAFARATAAWEPRFLSDYFANEHFKIAIRVHPTARCWSWALEWNQSHRLVGFFGDEEEAKRVIRSLPVLDDKVIARHAGGTITARLERRLAEDEDILFR